MAGNQLEASLEYESDSGNRYEVDLVECKRLVE